MDESPKFSDAQVLTYSLTSKGQDLVRALAAFEAELLALTDGEDVPRHVRHLCWSWFHSGYKARAAEDAETLDVGEVG